MASFFKKLSQLVRKRVCEWHCHHWAIPPYMATKSRLFKILSKVGLLEFIHRQHNSYYAQLFLQLNLCFHFGFEIEKSTRVGASPAQTVARAEKWFGCVCRLRNSIRDAFLVIMPPQIYLFAFLQHQASLFALSVLDILVPVFVQINCSDWLNQTCWRKIPQ